MGIGRRGWIVLEVGVVGLGCLRAVVVYLAGLRMCEVVKLAWLKKACEVFDLAGAGVFVRGPCCVSRVAHAG